MQPTIINVPQWFVDSYMECHEPPISPNDVRSWFTEYSGYVDLGYSKSYTLRIMNMCDMNL